MADNTLEGMIRKARHRPPRHRATEKPGREFHELHQNRPIIAGTWRAATQGRPSTRVQGQTFFSFQRPRRKTRTPTTASVEKAMVTEAKTPRGPSPTTRART